MGDQDFFENIDLDRGPAVDPENAGIEIVSIDTDEIKTGAEEDAKKMCKELQDMYFDEEFMKAHPTLRARIDQEIYALYVLLKMRRSDEIIHDLNIKSIASNPANASLYRALNQTQASLMSLQRQIDDKVKDITALMKEKQTEIQFVDPTQEAQNQEEQPVGNTHRGSKSFIEDMKASQEKKDPTLFDKTPSQESV